MPDPSQRSSAQGTVLTAHFFGGFWVTVDGQLVDTTSHRRSREVLAYLLAHRRCPVPRDVLTDAFWSDVEPAAARNSLHVALSGVRQALLAVHPHPVIEHQFQTYHISTSLTVWSDVEQFESDCVAARRTAREGDDAATLSHLASACQLYEGDFLADEPYVEWAAPAREALRLEAIDAECRLMKVYLDRGEVGVATVLGRRILTIDPCNEQVHRRLMRCYVDCGQRHLAFAQYHRLAAALWKTFRVHPSAETNSLYERLRRPLSAELT